MSLTDNHETGSYATRRAVCHQVVLSLYINGVAIPSIEVDWKRLLSVGFELFCDGFISCPFVFRSHCVQPMKDVAHCPGWSGDTYVPFR